MSGRRQLRKLLVANRGEIARRVLRAAAGMGIATVAVFSEPDRSALFPDDADEAVSLGGARASESYLDVGRILAAAAASGADALHPGYGFLAESFELAEGCAAAGITFVGPPPAAIRSMASKLEAKEIAARAGVPLLESVRVPAAGAPEQLLASAAEIGFPLLVKASAGGGGTGIRLVVSPEELLEATAVAAREAEAAFGDGTLFLERYLSSPHHVEIQVLADEEGTVVDLGERECSIQRRHQKVIEEAPSPSIDAGMREEMAKAAVALARAVGYVGAGTVEFLVESGRFYFLEMNTRLQVEHRVTEAVTGVDLVRAQLEIAAGGPVPVPGGPVAGHAIEARLYAEDPANGFAPSTGLITCFEHASDPGLLHDDGVGAGSQVSTFYDGLLSKLVVHARRREEAALRLARAVRALVVHGVVTNRRFLAAALESDDFLAGATDTTFVERHPELLDPPLGEAVEHSHLLAAAYGAAAASHRRSPVPFAPLSWRNVTTPPLARHLVEGGRELSVSFRPSTGSFEVLVDGRAHAARVRELDPPAGRLEVELDGVARRLTLHAHGEQLVVNSAEGQSDFSARSPLSRSDATAAGGSAEAPVPGSVARVLVAPGDRVSAGDTLVILESMKVEHRVRAPRDGVVAEIHARVGESVEAHAVLAVLVDAPADDGR